ncbi:MAG: hypothetical protein WA049_09725 [Ferribacterium limneticum]
MTIDSISRNAATSATRQPVETRLTQEVKQAERQEAKQQEISNRKAQEALQPVVNAQGQATGTLINIVA